MGRPYGIPKSVGNRTDFGYTSEALSLYAHRHNSEGKNKDGGLRDEHW